MSDSPALAMAKLHVWFDDCEYHVALSLEDAKASQREFSGCTAEDQEGADWSQLPDDGELRIWVDPKTGEVSVPCDGGVLVLGACGVWSEAYGRGFLCSTEY